jgi:pyrophosphatase PpaX
MTDARPPETPWSGVLFDLDGTLADTVELILICFRHTVKKHQGRELPDATFLRGIGTPLPVQLRGLARDDGEHEAMRQTYVSYQREIHDSMVRPFPGVASVLRTLRSSGTPVGIVTSKAAGIARRTMEVCGIHESVDLVVCGDEVRWGKPHPEPVLKAMAGLRLDAAPERVLFVGDSTHDLQAGRAAGTRTAAVGWGPIDRGILEAELPDFFLERMEDVLRVAPGGAPNRSRLT